MNRSIPTKEKRKFSIPELPNHIITDILSRLPIKTLFCCQLVCKDWLSFISDPHFTHLHLSKSPVSLLIKHPDHRQQLRLIDLGLQTLPNTHPKDAELKLTPRVNFPLRGHKIVNSCNGLLCLYDSGYAVFVCNPILREYISLPLARHKGLYDGTTSAFGFSPRTKEYKVIQFFLKKVSPRTYCEEVEAEIYTVGKGPWRNLGRVPYHPDNHIEHCFGSCSRIWQRSLGRAFYQPVNNSFYGSLNGALHWLTFTHSSPDFIRCFDFDNEQFRVVHEPPEFGIHKKEFPDRIRLGVLRESLSICDFSSPLHVEIWIMKDYGIKESWTKEFVIGNVIAKRGQLDYCEPIMILKSGEILMLVNKIALVQYNPKLGSFKNLKIYGIKTEFYAAGHISSLVSLPDVAKGARLTKNCLRKQRMSASMRLKTTLEEIRIALGSEECLLR